MLDLHDIIEAGGTGCADPATYDPATLAGFGASIYDYEDEPRQPASWRWGSPPSHEEARRNV